MLQFKSSTPAALLRAAARLNIHFMPLIVAKLCVSVEVKMLSLSEIITFGVPRLLIKRLKPQIHDLEL